MKIAYENRNIKCDSVNCNSISCVALDICSYKGTLFLCQNCFKQLQSLLKRNCQKNEQN